jgi:alpha-glucosidase
MVWDEARWDKPLRDYHRRLIHLRRESVALRQGGFQVLLTEADTVAYQRDSATERVLVFAHRGEQPRPAGDVPLTHAGVPDGTRFVDALGGAETSVRDGALPLPELAQGALILRQVA